MGTASRGLRCPEVSSREGRDSGCRIGGWGQDAVRAGGGEALRLAGGMKAELGECSSRKQKKSEFKKCGKLRQQGLLTDADRGPCVGCSQGRMVTHKQRRRGKRRSSTTTRRGTREDWQVRRVPRSEVGEGGQVRASSLEIGGGGGVPGNFQKSRLSGTVGKQASLQRGEKENEDAV